MPSKKDRKRKRSDPDSHGALKPERESASDDVTAAQPDDDGWQVVQNKSKKKKKSHGASDYPSITHAPSVRLQTRVKITDLQSLILYILADGVAPRWVAVRNHGGIRKVVVVMVPGLEMGMFNGQIPLGTLEAAGDSNVTPEDERNGQPHAALATNGTQAPKEGRSLSPDDYYPIKLETLPMPGPLKPLAGMFPYIWPVETPGDDRFHRIHSPLHAILTAPLPKSKEEKKKARPQWPNKRTPVTEFIATAAELDDDGFVLHPALLATAEEKAALLERRRRAGQSLEDGWVDTLVEKLEDGEAPDDEIESGSLTAGREVLALDCEMCLAVDGESVLTRISLVRWDGSVVMDELVKPGKGIKNYLTQFSGITEAMLKDVTTTLADVQTRLLGVITPRTVLVGHSLDSDLNALKLTHPFIVDTTLVFPHPRGPPLKSSLKWLAQKFLATSIQSGHGTTGHDSIQDARACLDLVKQKCERGPSWGTSDAAGESLFKRLGRSTKPQMGGAAQRFRTGAVVDWGNPRRGHGYHADVCIGCHNDAEVVEGIRTAVGGDGDGVAVPPGGVDFVWGRLRELEAVRGWWTRSKTEDSEELRHSALASAHARQPPGDADPPGEAAPAEAVERMVAHVSEIYASLPPCTALVLYSGTGDPREVARLGALQQQWKREYQAKNWDDISVKWTDEEEQAMRRAVKRARGGLGLVVVK